MKSLLLKLHLYAGLTAAIFLVVLGLTGTIMAFEGDIDHWVHPALWYVKPAARTLPEADLVRAAEQRFAPVRVAFVLIFREPNLVRVMQMTDRASVYVNPYDGSIQGRTTGPSRTQRTLGVIHQIHLRLASNPRAAFSAAGKKIISIAGLLLAALVPTGFILWWRTRRATINFRASWFRMCFDAHHAIGVYAALFLFIAAVTGVLIGFDSGEEIIYSVTRSGPPNFRERPAQSAPAPGAAAISADQAMDIARGAMPEATVAAIQLPLNPRAAFHVQMRVPEETSEAVHSTVSIDQFSGRVLKVRNFKTDSMGYRVIRFNRSIHTGDVLGAPTHVLVSLSSLLLVAMVVTGIIIWWKKLAV